MSVHNFDYRMNLYRKEIQASSMPKHLITAALNSLPTTDDDNRNFWLGAVGIRHDSAIVHSRNGSISCDRSFKRHEKLPSLHAEGRLIRKIGTFGKAIFVSRISRLDGSFAMALPCRMCSTIIISRNIEKVYYTVNNFQYGIWQVKKDQHKIFNIS